MEYEYGVVRLKLSTLQDESCYLDVQGGYSYEITQKPLILTIARWDDAHVIFSSDNREWSEFNYNHLANYIAGDFLNGDVQVEMDRAVFKKT